MPERCRIPTSLEHQQCCRTMKGDGIHGDVDAPQRFQAGFEWLKNGGNKY